MTKNPEHYAVVIGIDGYSQLPPLKSAVADARSFIEWLRGESGGGLPRVNIHALLSPSTPPADPFAAGPTQADVDHAFEKIIQANSNHPIKRLYFYFAGHGYGPSFDDVGMLMANASMNRLSSIRLREYRQFLRQSGHFPEVVFILDCSRVYLEDAAPAPSPSLALPPSADAIGSDDFILMASSHGEPAFEMTDATEGRCRGLLTKAVLEGLRGEAIDPYQCVTAVSLSNYVRYQVPKLAGGASLKQLPEILLPTQRIVFAEKSATSKSLSTGKLIVELPHWSAVVRIYDNFFRSITPGEIKPSPKSPKLFVSETDLPEGIFRVEVFLEGHSANQLVSISPDNPSRLTHDSWGLKIDSSAPLQGTTATYEKHTNPAAKWSRKRTWKNGPAGASRLFLFVRTSDPKRYKNFADGLQLLDSNEKLITDFSTGVEKNEKEGWMAFCCDLPPGFYILRRGRRGIPLRYQPLYLCAHWQTQVFLKARTAPSMSSLTLNMAEIGKGFVPNDETAIAAEVVLDGMKRGVSGKRLVTGSTLKALLQGKIENPWLGILAAYALGADETFSDEPLSRADEKSSAKLFKEVMSFLTTIKDHPDVRALTLKEKKKSDPFPFPPMLYAGLKLVQRHATQFSTTIPLNSLTDLILDDLVISSPWTSWRCAQITEQTKPKALKAKRQSARVSQDEAAPIAPLYLRSVAEQAPGDVAAEAALTTAASATAALNCAQVIDVAQKFARTGDIEALSETVALNPPQQLHDLLANVNPKEISTASGLPLARVEDALNHLVKSSESSPSATNDPGAPPLSKTEQVVLGCALKNAPVAAAMPAVENVETISTTGPRVNLDDCIRKIRAEADRIFLKYQNGGMTPVPEAKAKAEDLAGRLRKISTWLLERASFTAITNNEGRILSISDAFDYLLNPSNQKQWETALAAAPLGSSILQNPGADPAISPVLQELLLRRTAMEEDTTKAVHAYLNALRGKDAPILRLETIQQIDSVVPELSLNASFFIYDTSPRLSEHVEMLEKITAQLEQIVANEK